MENFLNYFVDHFPELVTALVGVITAFVSLIMLLISKHKTKEELEIAKLKLKKAQLDNISTKCPSCGSSVKLSDLHFYLPDGSKDDDLDGVADSD